jgi:hypothetical protein
LWLTESRKPRVISAVVALTKHPKVANAFNKGQDAGIPSKTEACNGCGDNDEVVDGEQTLPAQVPVAKNHKDGNKSRHMSRFDAADEVLVTAPNEAASGAPCFELLFSQHNTTVLSWQGMPFNG